MTDPIPDVPLRSTRRSLWDRMSVVWLVPLAALAIALGVAWQTWAAQGPLIVLLFEDASGVKANETELRYRDVTVGRVEKVRFTDNLDRVAVSVRLDATVMDYVDSESQFWVVRPEVSAQGVSGLETVLTGVFIQGLWDTEPGGLQSEFIGLDTAPLLADGQAGVRLRLRSSGGTLSGNTPLLYKGVNVGRIGPATVSLDGLTVEAEAVVLAPYDSLITESTRFWDTSGFSLSIGTSGASVNFDSLATLIAGGVTFDTFVSGAPLAEDDATFEVYGDADSARNSVFNAGEGPKLNLTAVFDGNVSGLSVDSAIELDGLRIGSVSGMNGIVETTPFGDDDVRLLTVLTIRPERLGFDGPDAPQQALDFFESQVEAGMRARLVTGNILTGGLKVQLVSRPEVLAASLDRDAAPYPRIPTTASDIVDVSSSAQGTLDRINALPIEELLESTRSFLDNAATLIGGEEMQATPEELRGLLADLRAVAGAEQTQALPEQIGSLMAELETTVSEVRAVLAQIEEERSVARVLDAVDAVVASTESVNAAIEGVPALIEQITAVAAKAEELDLETLVAEISAVTASADALINTDAARALPEDIGALIDELDLALAEARGLIADVNEAGGVDRLLAAVDAAGAAAQTLDTSLAGVPDLVARIDAVAAQAEAADLQTLVANATDLIASADALIGTDAARALPEDIGALIGELDLALAEARGLIADVNEAGGVDRLLAAVDAAGTAAQTLDTSLEGVPALIEQITAVAAKAEELDLETLVAEISAVTASADALINTDAARALPEDIGALIDELDLALAEARGLIADVNEAGGVDRLLAAVDAAGTAAQTLDTSLAGVPDLVARIDAVAAQAEAADLETLVANATDLIASADALIGTDAARALPGELNAALAELRTVVAELREGGVVENTNATLASARAAADSIAASAEGLPGMMDRANAILSQAGAVMAGFEQTSPVIRDTRAALREITRAADAFASLARALERRPNSLILGR